VLFFVSDKNFQLGTSIARKGEQMLSSNSNSAIFEPQLALAIVTIDILESGLDVLRPDRA